VPRGPGSCSTARENSSQPASLPIGQCCPRQGSGATPGQSRSVGRVGRRTSSANSAWREGPGCVQLATASPYAARHRFGRSLSGQSGPQKAKARRVSTPCHYQHITHRGTCRKPLFVLQNLRPKPEPSAGIQGFAKYVRFCRRVGLADVEPPVGLAVRLRALSAEVRVCGPPDCTEQLAEIQPC
jgi:hypothetical protein